MSTSDGTKTHKADGNISRMLENNYQEESAQRGWFSQLIRPADTDFIWYYALDFSQHGCMIVGGVDEHQQSQKSKNNYQL
jgi:hypothetical protein